MTHKITHEEIEENIKKCLNFDYNHYTEYVSELAHRIKTYGKDGFIERYGTVDEYKDAIEVGKHHAIFLVTLIEYLCKDIGKDFSTTEIDQCKDNRQFDFLLFSEGQVGEYELMGDTSLLEGDLELAIPVFLDKNLVVLEEHIYDVV